MTIANDEQLAATKWHLANFEKELETFGGVKAPENIAAEVWEAHLNGISVIISDLKEQIAEYEQRQDELELLAKPGDTMVESLECMGLTPEYFAHETGFSSDEIHSLFNGKMVIDERIAEKLQSFFKIDKQFWLNKDALYRENLKRLNADKTDSHE